MKKRTQINRPWFSIVLAAAGMASANAFAQPQEPLHPLSSTEGAYSSDLAKTEHGPVVKGRHWPKIGGWIHFDETFFLGKGKGSRFLSGAKIRRAGLELSGEFQKELGYTVALSLPEKAYLDSAYLTYTGIKETELNFGQLYGSYGLENNISPSDGFFLESSLASAFTPAEVLGISGITAFQDRITLAASIFQPKHGDPDKHPTDDKKTAGRSDKLGTMLRLTFSPVHDEETVYHLGFGGWHQQFDHGVKGTGEAIKKVAFYATPEASGRESVNLVNTGPIRARSKNTWEVDLAGRWGPLNLQTEYHQAHVNRVANSGEPSSNLRFYGWHVQGGYMLTGEPRPYDFLHGAFKRPKPENNRIGAWEVVARYSDINLNSKEIYGGKERNMSVGLNWYLNEHIRLSMNYVRAIAHPTAGIGADETTLNAGTRPADTKSKRRLNILAARLQVTF